VITIPIKFVLKVLNRKYDMPEVFSCNLLNELELNDLHSLFVSTEQDITKANQSSQEEEL